MIYELKLKLNQAQGKHRLWKNLFQKLLVQNNFGKKKWKNNLVKKKNLVKKIVVKKNWSKKRWTKKVFGLKQFWQKKFVSKNIW